jgi:nitric oxide synthase-interacting protein
MEAPRNCYRCPATKDHDIKFKKLYKMNLNDGGYPEASEFFCYACDKTLKFQKIGMSKHCGHVMCITCVDKVCLPEGKCMVCSKPFMKKDIVNILEAYSGYTAHN